MTEAQSLLLAILVRDFGYIREPLYGWYPLRHQFAWRAAVDGLAESDIATQIDRLRSGAEAEGERILGALNHCPRCGAFLNYGHACAEKPLGLACLICGCPHAAGTVSQHG